MGQALAERVFAFAAAYHHLPEHLLNNEGWGWDAYAGLRYGFLHITLALRTLAAQLATERAQPQTLAQQILARHQAAFRDFQALLIGLDEAGFTSEPAPGEWPIHTVLWHVHAVERGFFVHILNALRNAEPGRVDDAQALALLGEPVQPAMTGSLAEQWAAYARSHDHVLAALTGLTNVELAKLAPFWEPEALPISFRMHRFEAHLREHTNQLEKTLHLLKRPPNEAKLLLRQMYSALADVEGVLLGTGDWGEEACRQLATELDKRIQSMDAGITNANGLIEAVKAGDLEQVQGMLQTNPAWMYTKMEDGLSALSFSAYRGHSAVVDALLATGNELSLHEAAIVGKLAEIEAWLTYRPDLLNAYSTDGFTALQLACFFGRPAAAQRLLSAGSDVHAVSRNAMRIQPLHAAVAGRNLEIVKLLVAAGADVNAKQQDDFTPLMGAEQNQDAEMIAVLKAAGAQ